MRDGAYGEALPVFANPVLIDQDTTNGSGNWAIFKEDPRDGTYFAKVTKKRTGSGNHKHICKADKSPDLVADNTKGPTDKDGDDYFTGPGGDCDDTDAQRNPGADENDFDSKDTDCDGFGDDDESDHDGDSWNGVADCDDFDDTSHTGASEVLDGKDNDCDGLADEGFIEAGSYAGASSG